MGTYSRISTANHDSKKYSKNNVSLSTSVKTVAGRQASVLGGLASLMLSEGHKELEEWSHQGTMGDLVATV
jgi:hypothetical protein